MKREILVTWNCSAVARLDIADETLTREELDALAWKAARKVLPGDEDDCDWEWQGETPLAKGEGATPPDDCWFEVDGKEYATNGHCLIRKGCKVKIKNTSNWRTISDIAPAAKLLAADCAKLPPHTGWFDLAFQGFKKYRVVGNAPNSARSLHCGGYVLDEKGELLAILMPAALCDKPNREKYFQFNKTAQSE